MMDKRILQKSSQVFDLYIIVKQVNDKLIRHGFKYYTWKRNPYFIKEGHIVTSIMMTIQSNAV